MLPYTVVYIRTFASDKVTNLSGAGVDESPAREPRRSSRLASSSTARLNSDIVYELPGFGARSGGREAPEAVKERRGIFLSVVPRARLVLAHAIHAMKILLMGKSRVSTIDQSSSLNYTAVLRSNIAAESIDARDVVTGMLVKATLYIISSEI